MKKERIRKPFRYEGYKIDIVEDGCTACPYWVSDKYGNHACYREEYLRCKDGLDDYEEG